MQLYDLRKNKNYINEVKDSLKRHNEKLTHVKSNVLDIIEDVKENGDKALKAYSEKFDKVVLNDIKISQEEIDAAYDSLDKDFLDVLKESKANIEKYHKSQHYSHFDINTEDKRLTQKVTPIERVGVYIPGGKAPYPSTVLMTAIPAKVAGVKEIALISPLRKDGKVDETILAVAKLCGISEVYASGGAGAIAALAYGTETIKPVYKICGPGNSYVTYAKKEVYGDVDIDMLAGPSEILVIAFRDSNPSYVAADLLSQAEHDENAASVLVTNCKKFANKVIKELEIQIEDLDKKETAKRAIENYGKIYVVDNEDIAFNIANEVAPEHLEIMLSEPFNYIDKVINAGTVFMGEYTPEPVGDYFAGSNHTIPTSGKAKFYSPLSTYDFLKRTSIVYYSKEQLKKDKDKIMAFAHREGLTAHAKAIEKRFDNGGN